MWASMWPAQLRQRSLNRLLFESSIHLEDVWRGVNCAAVVEAAVATTRSVLQREVGSIVGFCHNGFEKKSVKDLQPSRCEEYLV